jgi:hypothetical protein
MTVKEGQCGIQSNGQCRGIGGAIWGRGARPSRVPFSASSRKTRAHRGRSNLRASSARFTAERGARSPTPGGDVLPPGLFVFLAHLHPSMVKHGESRRIQPDPTESNHSMAAGEGARLCRRPAVATSAIQRDLGQLPALCLATLPRVTDPRLNSAFCTPHSGGIQANPT